MSVPIKEIKELHELPRDSEVARIKGWKLARMRDNTWALLDEDGESKDTSPELDPLIERWGIPIAAVTRICPT